jgi:hypothetical protein
MALSGGLVEVRGAVAVPATAVHERRQARRAVAADIAVANASAADQVALLALRR